MGEALEPGAMAEQRSGQNAHGERRRGGTAGGHEQKGKGLPPKRGFKGTNNRKIKIKLFKHSNGYINFR